MKIKKFLEIAEDVFNLIFHQDMSDMASTMINIDAIKADLIDSVDKILVKGGTADKIFQAFLPLAVMMLMIYFGTELIEIASDDGISYETFLRTVGMAIVSLLIMDNAFDIITQLYDVVINSEIGDALFSIVDKVTDVTLVTPADAFTDISLAAIAEGVMTFLFGGLTTLVFNIVLDLISVLLCLIFVAIIKTYIAYTVLMRSIKIGVYIACLPLTIGGAFTDDFLSMSVVRYIKKIIALFLEGPIILVIIKVVLKVTNDVISVNGVPIVGGAISGIIMMFILFGNLKQSSEIAESIVGL